MRSSMNHCTVTFSRTALYEPFESWKAFTLGAVETAATLLVALCATLSRFRILAMVRRA